MNNGKTVWYHVTSKQRLKRALEDGFLKAPLFVTDDPDIAELFAYRLGSEEPVVLELDLRSYRIHKDPDKYLDAKVVRANVSTTYIIKTRELK